MILSVLMTPMSMPSAWATTSTTHTCDASVVPASAVPACECMFLADADEWVDPAIPSQVSGSCLEFTAIVNPIAGGARSQILDWMGRMAFAYTCSASPDRKFSYKLNTNVVGGFPVVQSQLLETMADDSCNIGVGDATLREVAMNALGDQWWVYDELGKHVASIQAIPGDGVKRVWFYDGGTDEDEMLISWASGAVWQTAGPFYASELIKAPSM